MIKFKSKGVYISKKELYPEKDITDWEARNIEKMMDYSSYVGVLLYLISLCILNSQITMSNLLVKLCIFSIAIHRIHHKMSNFYEEGDIYERIMLKIDTFLSYVA